GHVFGCSTCVAFSAICAFSICVPRLFSFFFFNATATAEIYTLSLHDALPICTPAIPITRSRGKPVTFFITVHMASRGLLTTIARDRKSTRLNSSHVEISYAVFCLKKKKQSSKHARPSGWTQAEGRLDYR